ncbi:MAG: CDP-glycerol glycerophosphotransferase family protein [Jatrophihabitantaceae bacterium]
MAAFTFATGNARGLRRLPLYLLGAVATLLIPRTDRIWAFGSGIGPGEGALPLLRLARQRLAADVRLVWLAGSDDELARARSLGLDTVSKLSARGFWLTARARVLVVTHGQGDVNRYGARGGLLVQLWHGIPLKKLHLDSPAALSTPGRLRRAVLVRGFRAVGRQISLFPVSSERLVARIAGAFGVAPERVVVTGDPRDDVLLRGSADQRRADARALLEAALGPIPPSAAVVMYAPTWRDGDTDPATPDSQTWDELAEWLQRADAFLIVRSHPLGRGSYDGGPERSPRIRLLDATMLADLTPTLPAVDHLVTDYSSTAYDFSLVDGTTVFLAADVTSYVDSRGLYEPYWTFTGDRHVATWQHAIELLDELVRGDADAVATARAHARWLREEHFDHLDGRATERVLAEIRRLLGQPVPPPPAPRRRPTVTAIRIESDRLLLTIEAGDVEIRSAYLDGPRGRVEATMYASDGAVQLEFGLLVTRWGTADLALPSGDYRLTLLTTAATTRVDVAVAQLPSALHESFRAGADDDGGGLVLRIEAPLADDERGAAAQRALRLRYALSVVRPESAVYFESFYGRTASDNPAAIDRALARLRPDVRRYWSVADRSIAVPDGAIPVVEGSREWWRVRAAARAYVINDWLRGTHRPRRGQRVLQTWHGTMLKRLALDRPNTTPRTRFATRRQSRWWTAMLAQNDYSATIFRTSYAFDGPIWPTGYPRNDVLTDPDRAGEVRRLLGIDDDARIVLYAPTWRDDRTELVDHLELARFAADLPPGQLLLVRGHSRTLGHGRELQGERLLDVTGYPDVAELMLIADVLVTDYSSVMFDFASTGKPLVFFTPDLAHYTEVLRGFYFDLTVDAPGPLVLTPAQLQAALRDLQRTARSYAARYAAWQARFTPCDDGKAAERVVQRMIDEGWLG